jgi:hypothetical protein
VRHAGVGLICNFLIKPVDPKWYMSEGEVAKLQAASGVAASGSFGIGRAAAIFWGSFGIGKGGTGAPGYWSRKSIRRCASRR